MHKTMGQIACGFLGSLRGWGKHYCHFVAIIEWLLCTYLGFLSGHGAEHH